MPWISNFFNSLEEIKANVPRVYAAGEAAGREAAGEERYEEGKSDAYAEIDNLNAELEQTLYGTDTGGKSHYEEFWDSTKNDNSWTYRYAGQMWNTTTFRPTYNLYPTGNCNYVFNGNRLDVDLVEFLDSIGIELVFSNVSSCAYGFSYCPATRLGELDFSATTSLASTFASARNLRTIDLLKINENTQFPSTFNNCDALENITFDGVIGQSVDFKSCTLLTHDSLMNIITALKDYSTEGGTHTLTMGNTNIEKLTDDEQRIITQKGWAIA